jgi:hypothetical protein
VGAIGAFGAFHVPSSGFKVIRNSVRFVIPAWIAGIQVYIDVSGQRENGKLKIIGLEKL